uniref:Uncharacterized protein n=1 Tax=Manihot esculenta TaxID=3983 RepID=A0A2C9UBH5_MANES
MTQPRLYQSNCEFFLAERVIRSRKHAPLSETSVSCLSMYAAELESN